MSLHSIVLTLFVLQCIRGAITFYCERTAVYDHIRSVNEEKDIFSHAKTGIRIRNLQDLFSVTRFFCDPFLSCGHKSKVVSHMPFQANGYRLNISIRPCDEITCLIKEVSSADDNRTNTPYDRTIYSEYRVISCVEKNNFR